MSCRMLPLKWVTIFFVTWCGCGIGCNNFDELFIEDANEYSNSTGSAITFLIKNISASDIHIVATESFFNHNYTAVAMQFSHVSFTLLNIERWWFNQFKSKMFLTHIFWQAIGCHWKLSYNGCGGAIFGYTLSSIT